jgi:hypothetical protein
MKWLFENVAKLAAALSFALLVASNIHDWAYFWVLGSKFRSIQTTYDYITNALEWLPTVSSACFAGFAFAEVQDRLTKKDDQDAGFQDKRIRKAISKLKPLAIGAGMFSLFFLISGLLRSFPGNVIQIVYALTSAITAAFFIWVSRVGRRSVDWIWSLIIVPILMMVFAFGIIDANFDLHGYRNVYRLDLKGGISQQVSLLRSFEKGVLVRLPASESIEFVRWEQIDRIGRVARLSDELMICSVFSIFCDKSETP